MQDVIEHNGTINLGDSAEASTFAAGALVYYRDKNNEILQVSIKCVHYDDDPPYFTISLAAGALSLAGALSGQLLSVVLPKGASLL